MNNKFKLPKVAKKHPIAFWIAVVLHAGLLSALGISTIQKLEVEQKQKTYKIPKAVTVDFKEMEKERKRLIDYKKNKKLKLEQREKRVRDLKKAEKKIENERYKEQQRLKKLKAKTKKEAKKAKDAKKRKEAEQKAAKKAKKQKESEQKQAKAAKKQKESEQKQAKVAKKQKELVEKLRDLQKQKFADEQNKRNLTKEVQAEQDHERKQSISEVLNKLKISYINHIGSRVRENWRYQGAKDDWSCRVRIVQGQNGVVLGKHITGCKIDDSAKAKSFKNSIERAIEKASPLPYAPDASVFDSEIEFDFRVN